MSRLKMTFLSFWCVVLVPFFEIWGKKSFLLAWSCLECPKRQQDTTYNIQQKTRQMSRHYWDIYTTWHWVFKKEKIKKNMKRNFFQNFKFFYIKLPNVICCIQCHDMCCLLDVFCCILMSWHMLRHWTVYWPLWSIHNNSMENCIGNNRFFKSWRDASYLEHVAKNNSMREKSSLFL